MATERRLIDPSELWQKTFVCDEVAEVRKFIEQATTVNAVEVVRCKDCKFWNTLPSDETPSCRVFCALHSKAYRTNASDFCSYGERRTDND